MNANTPAFQRRAGYRIVEKIAQTGGLGDTGWSAVVELVDGTQVRCSLQRGRRVRVAFKPRTFVGFKWYGRVMRDGRELWSDEVSKTAGIALMLEQAGLIDRGRCGRVMSHSYFDGKLSVRRCRNIKLKSCTTRWCAGCMELLEQQTLYFYNERWYTDDATGRWADDGGKPI